MKSLTVSVVSLQQLCAKLSQNLLLHLTFAPYFCTFAPCPMPAKKKDGDEPTAGGGAAGGAPPAQNRGKRTPQGPPPNKGAQIDPGTAALRPSQRVFSRSAPLSPFSQPTKRR